MNLTLKQYLEGIQNNTLDPKEVYQHYLDKAKNNDSYHAFLRINENTNQEDQKNQETGKDHLKNTPLLGAPIALKDNIMLEGVISSCGSKMLENYVAPYTATCVKNLQNNGANIIGMTNMDEFAMGSTTATSYFCVTLNPHGKNRLPGGSSGGSAAAVAGDLCLGALGSDTGGSVRQPAARCGVVGMKPTYGRISRYGVQAMASSLDQIGIFAKTVEDCKILIENTMGHDSHDTQSQTKANEKIERNNKPLNEYTIAIPNTLLGEGLDPIIKTRFLEIIEQLKHQGTKIDYINLPILEQIVSMYYIIQPAEASTNLARFDGLRFGLQKNTKGFDGIMDYITAIRSEGFGEEVKRRIMLGTFVLSS
ncbi:MAG: Asp-tRNA(Asn)/Glu-tRNA(Gln) amidotransferase GatCAB subunit A, partial [candidate division SR1 bacterium]